MYVHPVYASVRPMDGVHPPHLREAERSLVTTESLRRPLGISKGGLKDIIWPQSLSGDLIYSQKPLRLRGPQGNSEGPGSLALGGLREPEAQGPRGGSQKVQKT